MNRGFEVRLRELKSLEGSNGGSQQAGLFQILLGRIIGGKSSFRYRGLVGFVRGRNRSRNASAARALMSPSGREILIFLRPQQHGDHAVASGSSGAPFFSLTRNRCTPSRSTDKVRTAAISGSQPRDYPHRRILSGVRWIALFGGVALQSRIALSKGSRRLHRAPQATRAQKPRLE